MIHKYWLEKLGAEGDYGRAHIRADELGDYLAKRRSDPDWRGCNVTIPHKQSIRGLLDKVSDQGVGAVNCVLPEGGRLIGRNTDVAGILGALPAGMDVSRPIGLIGAGGAARAAVAALQELGFSQLKIVVRDRARGEALLGSFDAQGEVFGFEQAAEALQGCAGVINASPLGMVGQAAMPGSVLRGLARLQPRAFVFDAVYAPLRTELLREAERHGVISIDGLTMLIGQAEEAFRLFFGLEPPVAAQAELRERLTR